MSTLGSTPPATAAAALWKSEPWARSEARRHGWAMLPWFVIMFVCALLFVPLFVFATSSIAMAVVIAAFLGGVGTWLTSIVAILVRESNQKAFIAAELSRGVAPLDVRGIPDQPGRWTFAKRLFWANAVAFVVVGVPAFLVARAGLGL